MIPYQSKGYDTLTWRKPHWQNDARVRARIAAAAERSGRAADEVTLIAISKTHPSAVVSKLVALGATDVGENRVQEEKKIVEVGRNQARWHLAGHLQATRPDAP